MDPERIRFADSHVKKIKELSPSAVTVITSDVDELHRQQHLEGRFLDPPEIASLLRKILSDPEVKTSLRLD